MANSNKKEIGVIFGIVLQKYRFKLDISQEELAFRAEVDRTFVSRIERGIRQPTISTIIGLSKALEISASELIRETEAACKRAKLLK